MAAETRDFWVYAWCRWIRLGGLSHPLTPAALMCRAWMRDLALQYARDRGWRSAALGDCYPGES